MLPLPHDQRFLVFLSAAVMAANLAGIGSVVVAARKEKETISRGGLTLGAVGLLIGLRLCYLIDWAFHPNLLSISIAVPPLLSALGMILSLRESGVWLPMSTALFTFLVSPVLVRHGCGLRSWPLEMSIGFLFAVGAFLLVSMTKRKWLAWALDGAFVVASCLATDAYIRVLHSAAFPQALLDDSGRAWKSTFKQLPQDEGVGPSKASPSPSPALPAPATQTHRP